MSTISGDNGCALVGFRIPINYFTEVYIVIKPLCRAYQAAAYVGAIFLPWRKPLVISGEGAVKELPALIKNRGVSRALIVTDAVLERLGEPTKLADALKKEGVDSVIFSGVQPNPTVDNVEEALRYYRERRCDAVIAFGGGSPMDCAKITAARVARPELSIPQMKGLLKIRKKLPLLCAVPTTAGTGSETTLAAVVTEPAARSKYAINDPSLIPAVAVLDPLLTVGLPPSITAATGMDALCHAVEAYIGHANTPSTRRHALEAVALINEYLPRAFADGKDIEARHKMLEASHRAGLAFTRAYVGCVHAVAHALGGTYGTPHGLANACAMPYVLRAYGKSAEKRLAQLAELIGLAPNGSDAEKSAAFIARIEQLNAAMGIPAKITGIREEDIPALAAHAEKEANPLYPVPKILDVADFERIFRELRAS